MRIVKLLVFLIISATPAIAGAQVSYMLPEVEVKDSLVDVFHLAGEIMEIDSNRIGPVQGIQTVMVERTHSFVRNYGPGRLATISRKGASPQQTAIVYKGFNMQNPTLGLTDLSLFSGFLFDQLSTGTYSGALMGSGVMNNAVQLSSSAADLDQVGYAGSYGGLDHWFQGLAFQRNKPGNRTILKGYFDGARNDLQYAGIGGNVKRLPHAAHRQAGFLAEHHMELKNGHSLQLFGTHVFARREIPPTRFQSASEAVQDDQAGRYGTVYQHKNENRILSARAIWMTDRVDYRDPRIGLASRNRAQTVQAIGQYFKKWDLYSHSLLQVEWTFQQGNSNTYENRPQRNQAAAVLAFKRLFPGLKSALSVASRLQWNEFGGFSILPFGEIRTSVTDHFQCFFQVQRTFRIPALDDLFWIPGGNPDLEDESGWHQEFGVSLNARSGGWDHRLNASGFHRAVRNWILWIPVISQTWSPRNIAQVSSRGLETTYTGQYQQGDVRISALLIYTFQKVTESSDDPLLAGREGNTLIYMPDHQFKINAWFNYRDFGIGLHHRLTSQVFSDPANEQTIPAYSLANVSFQYGMKYNKTDLTARVSIDNIFDRDYEVVANHPMPGRLFYFSIIANFKQ